MNKPRKKGETRGRKKGQTVGEYARRYKPTCMMCGYEFPSARPDTRTGSNVCRSALRRWVAKYGHEPKDPPGHTPEGKKLDGCAPWAIQAKKPPILPKKKRAAKPTTSKPKSPPDWKKCKTW